MNSEIRTPKTPQEWAKYYTVRYKELRKPWGQPVGSERDDKEDQALHYALFSANDLVGVLRVDQTDTPDTVQFRFMAVTKDHQGKGFGELLMTHAENEARSTGTKKVILHAREVALNFYKKLGYETIEQSHLLFGEIQHFLMKKDL
jgi:GNAT superfamily N-acetyltransferase